MGIITRLLFGASLALVVAGAFFGRASWMGINNNRIAIWQLQEVAGLVTLVLAITFLFAWRR